MAEQKSSEHKWKLRLIDFKGKNRRIYVTAAAMLALITAPFGLYAALNHNNSFFSLIFFTIITGCMLLILLIS